jgi:hypothetical protein
VVVANILLAPKHKVIYMTPFDDCLRWILNTIYYYSVDYEEHNSTKSMYGYGTVNLFKYIKVNNYYNLGKEWT